MTARGYTHCQVQRPPADTLLRWWDERTNREWTGTLENLPQGTGSNYLWWKMTGIERTFTAHATRPGD